MQLGHQVLQLLFTTAIKYYGNYRLHVSAMKIKQEMTVNVYFLLSMSVLLYETLLYNLVHAQLVMSPVESTRWWLYYSHNLMYMNIIIN